MELLDVRRRDLLPSDPGAEARAPGPPLPLIASLEKDSGPDGVPAPGPAVLDLLTAFLLRFSAEIVSFRMRLASFSRPATFFLASLVARSTSAL